MKQTLEWWQRELSPWPLVMTSLCLALFTNLLLHIELTARRLSPPRIVIEAECVRLKAIPCLEADKEAAEVIVTLERSAKQVGHIRTRLVESTGWLPYFTLVSVVMGVFALLQRPRWPGLVILPIWFATAVFTYLRGLFG